MKKTFPFFLTVLMGGVFLAGGVLARMSSDNFKINADVMGAGGALGGSDNFNLNDTVGEPVIGLSESDNFKAQQGFWYMVGTSLTLSIDSDTVNLGLVTPGSSGEGQSVLSVTTDAWGGYELYISENHALLHNDATTTLPDIACSIASPCLWSGYGLGFTVKEGTGVAVKWGTSPDYKYAAIPLSSTKFHDKIGYSSGADETTVGYKVVPAPTQKSGPYSNVVTFVALEKL